jgi:hypothetical protein
MVEQLLGHRLDAPVTGVGDPAGQNVASDGAAGSIAAGGQSGEIQIVSQLF